MGIEIILYTRGTFYLPKDYEKNEQRLIIQQRVYIDLQIFKNLNQKCDIQKRKKDLRNGESSLEKKSNLIFIIEAKKSRNDDQIIFSLNVPKVNDNIR